MKVAVVLALLAVLATSVARAEEREKSYYIERYPNDGINQRPKKVPSKKVGEGILQGVLPQRLESAASTNAVENGSTNSAPTKAARYISPRVSSKSWLPSRKPHPKQKIVVVPAHEKKIPPPPSVTEKPGAGVVTLDKPTETAAAATNSPPADVETETSAAD